MIGKMSNENEEANTNTATETTASSKTVVTTKPVSEKTTTSHHKDGNDVNDSNNSNGNSGRDNDRLDKKEATDVTSSLTKDDLNASNADAANASSRIAANTNTTDTSAKKNITMKASQGDHWKGNTDNDTNETQGKLIPTLTSKSTPSSNTKLASSTSSATAAVAVPIATSAVAVPPVVPASSTTTPISSIPSVSSTAPVKVGSTTVIGGMSSSIHPTMTTKMTTSMAMKPFIIPPTTTTTTATATVNSINLNTTAKETSTLASKSTMNSAATASATITTNDKAISTNQQTQPLQPPPSKQTTETPQTQSQEPQSIPPKPKTPQLIPHPIINTDMKQIISDILILLQTYGPLTVYQIEYNLPPYPSLESFKNTAATATDQLNNVDETLFPSTSCSLKSLSQEEYRFKIIQDVLDVLTVIQVIHKTKITIENDPLMSMPLSSLMSKTSVTTNAKKDAFGGGSGGDCDIIASTTIASTNPAATETKSALMNTSSSTLLSSIPEQTVVPSPSNDENKTNDIGNSNNNNETYTNLSRNVDSLTKTNDNNNHTIQKEQQMINNPNEEQDENNEKILYFFHNGKVRGDVIYPWEIMDMIQDANQEIDETLDRINLLKKELGVLDTITSSTTTTNNTTTEDSTNGDGTISPPPTTTIKPLVKSGRKRKIDKLNEFAIMDNTEPVAMTPVVATSIPPSQRMKTTREFLKVLLLKYPDIVYDPVYNAALRNFNVDLGAVERERERSSNKLSNGTLAVSAEVGTAGDSSSCGSIGAISDGVVGKVKRSTGKNFGNQGSSATSGSSGKKRQLSTGQGPSATGKKRRRKTSVSKGVHPNERNKSTNVPAASTGKQTLNGVESILTNNGANNKDTQQTQSKNGKEMVDIAVEQAIAKNSGSIKVVEKLPNQIAQSNPSTVGNSNTPITISQKDKSPKSQTLATSAQREISLSINKDNNNIALKSANNTNTIVEGAKELKVNVAEKVSNGTAPNQNEGKEKAQEANPTS